MDKKTATKYLESSRRALEWLDSQLTEDGSYGDAVPDLASYYKSPYLYASAGKTKEANLLLDHIKNTFMRDNGDFTTAPDSKSENGAFVEYWAYTNGWIARAALKLGRKDVSDSAYKYLKTYFHPNLGGYTTNKPYGEGNNVVDVLTTAHLGLVALETGDTTVAKKAGDLLADFVEKQPDLSTNFYLRMSSDRKIGTEFPDDAAIFFTVRADQPNQAYFMIGYPLAFLGLLHRQMKASKYLDTAKKYMDFAMSCHDGIFSFYFSHKVAWGAAILANITGEKRCSEFAQKIGDYLLSIQDDEGTWLASEPAHTSFDQTAEIAIWLKEIAKELS